MFDQIDQNELQSLVDNKVPEGLYIEYKTEQWGGKDDDRKELLKDVTSFSNTFGGAIIVGMSEEKGIATGIVPLKCIDLDLEISRIESIINAGAEPEIFGIRIQRVSVEGGTVIVIHIPQSFSAPHRIRYKRNHRYWARNSNGKYELGVEGLRLMFLRKFELEKEISEFVGRRRELVAKNVTCVPIPKDKMKYVVHLMPFQADPTTPAFDLMKIKRNSDIFSNIIGGGDLRYNIDGIYIFDNLPEANRYIQIFRRGGLEIVGTIDFLYADASSDTVSKFFGEVAVKLIAGAVVDGLQALSESFVPMPIAVDISLEKTDSTDMLINNRGRHRNNRFSDPSIPLPSLYFDRYISENECISRLLYPFDVLWNAYGFDRCHMYQEQREEREAPAD